jgi:hypothetical protein
VLGRRRGAIDSSLTSGQQMRAELGEGLGHLWLAAGHGAETLGPRLRGMRTVALVPLAAAARLSAVEAGKVGKRAMAKAPRTKESKMSRKRTRWLAGMLAAGTAAGVTGAMMARRRSRSRWEEYESQGRATMPMDMGSRSDTATAVDTGWPAATPARQTARDWATSTKDSGPSLTAEKVPESMDMATEKLSDKSSTVSKNSRR